MSAAADSGISTSSLVHERQNEVQDIVAIPTSNPNSMPVEMERVGTVVDGDQKNYYMHKTMLMESQLGYSAECALPRTVPGANSNPGYL